MKTRKLISYLRAVTELIALVLIVLTVIIFAMHQYAFCNFAVNHWQIGCVLVLIYIALTVCEDYFNYRILHFGR